MVSLEKNSNALKIIQKLVIHARKMAYDKESHEKIAALLDDIEYLPGLINDASDQTETFRQYVVGIADKYGWQGLVDVFDD